MFLDVSSFTMLFSIFLYPPLNYLTGRVNRTTSCLRSTSHLTIILLDYRGGTAIPFQDRSWLIAYRSHSIGAVIPKVEYYIPRTHSIWPFAIIDIRMKFISLEGWLIRSMGNRFWYWIAKPSKSMLQFTSSVKCLSEDIKVSKRRMK